MNKELEDIKSRLENIAQQMQSCRDQIGRLQQQESELIIRAVELKHGIKIGSVVVYKGVEHRVAGISTAWGFDRPCLSGNPRKKDGTFGTANRNLYDQWTKKNANTSN